MYINPTDRTPEYFGAVAKRCGLPLTANPYGKLDGRKADWQAGYLTGIITETPIEKK